MGLIYCATNKVNGKKYIGKTTRSLMERKEEHFKESKRKSSEFQRDLMRHEFKWEEVEIVDDDVLNKKEMEYIKKYNTGDISVGYNKNVTKEKTGKLKGVKEITDEDVKEIKKMLGEGKYQRQISRELGINRDVVRGINDTKKGGDKKTGYKYTYEDALKVRELVSKGTLNLNNISYQLNFSKDFVNGVFNSKYYSVVDDDMRVKYKNTPKVDNGEVSNRKSVSKEESIKIVRYIVREYKHKTVIDMAKEVGVSESLVYNIVLGYAWENVWEYVEYYDGVIRDKWLDEVREIKRG